MPFFELRDHENRIREVQLVYRKVVPRRFKGFGALKGHEAVVEEAVVEEAVVEEAVEPPPGPPEPPPGPSEANT